MITYPLRQRLIVPITPMLAVAAAIFAAAAALACPQSWLDAGVLASGIPAILPAAEPPLGLTARLALMVTGGGAAGALAWAAAYLALGSRGFAINLKRRHRPRRTATPDASDARRAPLIATRDLGMPFLAVKSAPPPPVERDLPADLDAPLARFDPGAIPDEPARPVDLVAPLAPPVAPAPRPADRIDAYELPPPMTAPETAATISALLERLERGVAGRTAAMPASAPVPLQSALASDTSAHATGLESALGELRRLAAAR